VVVGGTPRAGWLVEVRSSVADKTVDGWDPAQGPLTVRVPRWDVPQSVPLDVAFIIDATGSMSDEIRRIQETLVAVTSQLRASRPVDLRYGAVAYRDRGDAFVTKTHAFTNDVAEFESALRGLRAAGGGDTPESLNQALATAVGGLSWRSGAAAVAFLVADAPPHMDYQESVTYAHASVVALSRGIRIHTVAASGLDEMGTLVFRQIAQMTRGKFIFIEYGSLEATKASHKVTGPVESNNLDAILLKEIEAEVGAWGVPDLV